VKSSTSKTKTMPDESIMKKQGLKEENRVLQQQWPQKWCFFGNTGSIISTICKQWVFQKSKTWDNIIKLNIQISTKRMLVISGSNK